jgi:hypothetical protein
MDPVQPVPILRVVPATGNPTPHARRRDYFRTQNGRRRAETMLQYGDGACARCGANDIRILELDHIHGTGNADRIARTGGCRGGVPFYRALKAAGWPHGFQVLCANCHRIKTLGA